jgi:hypothetical protein
MPGLPSAWACDEAAVQTNSIAAPQWQRCALRRYKPAIATAGVRLTSGEVASKAG